jgi:TolB-like protein
MGLAVILIFVLEGVAVSGAVREQIGNRLDIQFEDMGEHELKNIERPIRVYNVFSNSPRSSEVPTLALPSKPSIAVLPFINMSAEPEQEHFADGLTEDLFTDLSRIAGLFVIARNSTFAYKGKSVDARRLASDLGVRYLLEGSARRAGGRVRINVQLIDAIGGGHLWAERFDRNLEDIFAVQDEVTAKIVEALVGRLTAPPPRNKPANLNAYDLCVRARNMSFQTALAAREARLLLERAIALDPEYAEAHRWLALNLWLGWEWPTSRSHRTCTQSAPAQSAPTMLVLLDAGAGPICASRLRVCGPDIAQARNLSHDIASHTRGKPGPTRPSGGSTLGGRDVHDEQSELHDPALGSFATFSRRRGAPAFC